MESRIKYVTDQLIEDDSILNVSAGEEELAIGVAKNGNYSVAAA